LRELDVGDSGFILKIAQFLRNVLPDATTTTTPKLWETPSKLQAIHLGTTPTPQSPKQSATATQSKYVAATRLHSVAIPSTSSTSEVFETPENNLTRVATMPLITQTITKQSVKTYARSVEVISVRYLARI
jgi:hypothetical protein